VLGSFGQVHKSHLAIQGDDGIVRMDVAMKEASFMEDL